MYALTQSAAAEAYSAPRKPDGDPYRETFRSSVPSEPFVVVIL